MDPMLPSQITLKWGCVGCAGEEEEGFPGKLGLYKQLVIGAWIKLSVAASLSPWPLACPLIV